MELLWQIMVSAKKKGQQQNQLPDATKVYMKEYYDKCNKTKPNLVMNRIRMLNNVGKSIMMLIYSNLKGQGQVRWIARKAGMRSWKRKMN